MGNIFDDFDLDIQKITDNNIEPNSFAASSLCSVLWYPCSSNLTNTTKESECRPCQTNGCPYETEMCTPRQSVVLACAQPQNIGIAL